ncbi:hypothetical protein NQ317_002018 [Molorchus minor]|uniref:Uncharacterized protein n=1 Tax=Molorchus minor TaxID=1323400 RepID=A0ABQ9JAE5_9CUCU|nr:hypothetical protein NQ317_002018 [Molorchus minor]
MKCLVVLASVILAINAASVEELWAQFKENHGRQYRNIREEETRFNFFKQNVQRIEEHNAKYEKGETSYYRGINRFSDKSREEIHAMLNTSRANRPILTSGVEYKPSNVQVASEVNWVNEGVVTGVKNQGDCGSCWAFSVTGTLEGQYAIKYGSLVSLSEQDLVDCSVTYGTAGCNGGWMALAYDYVKDNGISTESDYPYLGYEATCAHSSSVLTVNDYVFIPEGDEYTLKDAVANVGPISVSVYADDFFDYAGGIFDESSCSQEYDHGVLVVGYGEENGSEYWLVKNSWGADWGDNGYIKMAREKNNQCAIASYASYTSIN